MSVTSRVSGIVGLAVSQLRGDRARTIIAVCGVAFAVLSVTLLFGAGTGVVGTGETLLEESGRDLWVTGGEIELQPGSVGGFQNPIVDAHDVATEMEEHEDVAAASPLALQTVYVSDDGEDFNTIVATGVRTGSSLDYQAGEPFESGTTQHRAGGSYDGPRTNQVIVDPALAEQFGVDIGDTIYVGGTIADARQTRLEIVGISGTYREFVGSEVIVLPLSELQTMTGNAYDDRATYISVDVRDGADPQTVATDLEQSHSKYDVRTNREQLTTVLQRQATVIAGGLSLTVLSVITGTVLSLNLFVSMMHQQRRTFAVFRAVGGSRRSVLLLALVEVLLIAGLGCTIGLVLTPVLAAALNQLAASITGFQSLITVPPTSYLAGAGVAVCFSLLGMVVGVVRLTRGSSVAQTVQ